MCSKLSRRDERCGSFAMVARTLSDSIAFVNTGGHRRVDSSVLMTHLPLHDFGINERIGLTRSAVAKASECRVAFGNGVCQSFRLLL